MTFISIMRLILGEKLSNAKRNVSLNLRYELNFFFEFNPLELYAFVNETIRNILF